ncbi:competence protein CoiA family protein [Parachitinimonas caeni]|uniref:Competence protein CoiA family protein n=1 Tax=Parachitinimonas caeni TaxID=3031301 RepID=A0ABT7E2F4_9NEIS|nr:competence protein CoiA family protein [Parachitinimonas caeni]MDK2126498.1 competence protein CoiA family protein [Parachitinimonas caeni]
MAIVGLLQQFAFNQDQQLVSVREVRRGLHCACFCPLCSTPLMARQGEVRTWHFAHPPHQANCSGAAESALHLAAKACLQRSRALQLPAFSITGKACLQDGRQATIHLPQAPWIVQFTAVELERRFGDLRPDVYVTGPDGPLLVEIAVTHAVTPEKRVKLQSLGIPALEINLSAWHGLDWDWETLTEQVTQTLDNRHWIVPPDLSSLQRTANVRAWEQAMALPIPEVIPDGTQTRVIGKAKLTLYFQPRSIVVHVAGYLEEKPFQGLRQLMYRLKGEWRCQKGNWRLPRHAGKALLEGIRTLQ